MAKQIIHYATAPRTPLCYNGTTDRVTKSLPAVTCSNCIDAKRRETLAAVADWDALQTKIHSLLPVATKRVNEFGATAGITGRASEESYPPRIMLRFSIPERPDKRRKAYGGCAIPTDDEMDTIASFVGELADELDLRTGKMTRPTPALLVYDLKTFYAKR